MARPLTPQSINTAAGVIGVLAVLGIAAYMYLSMASVPAASPATTSYNLSVISDLKAPDATNVFEKTSVLLSGGNAQAATATAAPVTYSSDEIGKTDITKLGQ